MSSRADDFGAVDYDLGYDAGGWDTQGFRSPEAVYRDIEGTRRRGGVGTAAPPAAGRVGGHARAPGAHEARHLAAPGRAAPAPGRGAPGRAAPGRRARGGRVKVKGSWWRHWTLRKALGVTCGVIGGLIVLGAIAVVVAYEQTPVPTEAMAATGFQQSVVYSSNGTLIGRFGTMNRQMLTYSQLQQSKWLIPAVLAAEDRSFWTEGGVSLTGIVRAAYEDVKGSGGSLQGGSTITQQFVRNYYVGIGTQQTLSRKIKEIFVALKVARQKSKQWILTNYLNTIYLGEGAYGIGAAAQTYFGEPVSKLTAAQAAVLAAVIQQPSSYPLPQYRPELKARWRYVLGGMVAMGDLTARQAAAMRFPAFGDHVPQTVGSAVWDPYVLDVVRNELMDVYHFSEAQIDDGGYVIKTTIDDAKMAALYQAVQQNEDQMAADGEGLQPYMHVGAVLENPATGAIEAMYPGPGYPGARYNGVGHRITARECKIIACEVNMAVYNREQVGSSFKPYILATAVKQGMDVQTSTLDGYDPLYIPPDTQPNTYAVSSPAGAGYQWYKVTNDSPAENGPYTPQNAMAQSINTAYADLWHKVGGASVLDMAQAMGVNLAASGLDSMEHEAGVALGQGSLTVAEQATMLATIDDGGVYHDAHMIASITQPSSGTQTPIKITSYPVFSSNPQQNADEATQVQYAMSKTTVDGTATVAAMSDGREIIGKTGTTNTAQSAFFIGAIPQESLAIGLFTSDQNGTGSQTLNGLGGTSQGGFGGTWPATIWHTYAENEFLQLPIVLFPAPVFSGQPWNLVPPGLRQAPAKQHKKHHGPGRPNPFPTPPVPGNPTPFPSYSCDPQSGICVPVTGGPPGG